MAVHSRGVAPENRDSSKFHLHRTTRLPNCRAKFITAMSIIATIEEEQLKKDPAKFCVGDTVKVHTRVIEGDKERIQIYSGIVIGRKGTGINDNFTVRRVSYGEGVERVFPVHSPRIAKIEVERKGAIRRAKLNYLRDRKGKSATTVKEKIEARG